MNRTFIATAAALVACLALLGCSGDSEKELVAAARTALEKKDSKTAIIQLKNALQKNPQSGEVRFLLGKALMQSGDVGSAMLELGKARDLRFPDEQVLPVLAHGLLLQGQEKKLIDLYGKVALTEPRAAADLATSMGTAHARLGNLTQSKASIETALRLAPDFNPARMMQARIKASAGEFPAAVALIDQVNASEPGNPEGWQLKGDITAFGLADPKAALPIYEKAIEARKVYLPAYSNIILILIHQGDVEGAKAKLKQMATVAGAHPQTRYLEAQIALLTRDLKRARELTQQLVKAAPSNVKVLQLSGAVEYQLGALLQAETVLAKALQLEPDLPVARRLLAQTYLRSAQPGRALTVLAPQIEGNNPDAETLAIAAEAMLQNGNTEQAEVLFSRAARINPNDTKVRTALALTQMAKGNPEAAFASLQSIAATDNGNFADLALISARLRRRDLDGALKAIDGLEKKMADKPLPPNIRGRVQLAKGDVAGARVSFERALSIDPVYFPAAASLASLDLADKKPDAAKSRFDAMIKADPRNYRALLALAELRGRTGGSAAEVGALLTEAVKLNPTEADPRVVLIRHHLATKNNKAALTAAQEAVAALPDNPEVVDSLGEAQIKTGDTQQALASFKKVATMLPNSPQPQLRLAEAYMVVGDSKAAAQSLRRALDIAPNLLAAQRALIGLALRSKDIAEAMSVVRQIQKQRPQEAAGFALEGEVEANRKNWPAAATAYRAALQRSKNGDTAIKLHSTLQQAGQRAEATKFADEWLKANPRDTAFLFYAAGLAAQDKNLLLAEQRYRNVIDQQPDHVMALNNLAWILAKSGKPGAAALAERANAIAPDQPALMDTWAITLAAEKQLPRALEMQRKVVAAVPDNYAYRLTLARLLIQSGDSAAAKTELERLARLGNKFSAQDEVAALLKTL